MSASLANPRSPGLIFVEKDGSEARLSLADASGRIQAIAKILAERNRKGSPIGLLYRSEPNLIVNWFACIHAGLQPLILQYPTRKQSRDYWIDSIRNTTQSVALPTIISDDYCANLGVNEISRVIQQSELDNVPPASSGPLFPESFEIFQLSSGTTGFRKALRFASRELAEHVAAYNEVLSLTTDDRLVSWLPLSHDMGYVACFVMPLLLGVDIVMLDPMSWVQRPELLYDAIERHGGTICYMPNFGYEVMSRLAPRPLPSMRRWVSAGEPISAVTIGKFLNTIGAAPDTFAPLYGMAENIFAISLGRGCRTLSIDGSDLVSCGRPIPDVEVKTIDGELCVRSPTMPATYFDGRDIRGLDGFYPSGDLGHVIGGEIYVSGRKQDLLVQAGRKFLLSDIDLRLNEIRPEVRGRAAALAIYDERVGTETATILIEGVDFFERSDAADIATELEQATGLDQMEVVFVPPRFLTKTSSGKINRRRSGANWAAVQKSKLVSRRSRRNRVHELQASFATVSWDQPISEVLDSLSVTILGTILDGTAVPYERHWSLNDIAEAIEAGVPAEAPTASDTLRIASLADYERIIHVSEPHLERLERMIGCKVTLEHVCLPPSPIILSDLIFRDYFQPRLEQAPFESVDRVLEKLTGASILITDDMAELAFLAEGTFGALSHNFERDPRADLIAVRWQEYSQNHHNLPLTIVCGPEIPYSASTATLARLSRYLDVPIFRVANEPVFAKHTLDWDYRPLGGHFGGALDPDRLVDRLADWLHTQDLAKLQRAAKPGPKLILRDLAHFCSQSVRKSAIDAVVSRFNSFCVAGLPCSVPYLRMELERLGKRYVQIPSYAPEIFGSLSEQYECVLSCGGFGDVTPDVPVISLMHVGQTWRTRNAGNLTGLLGDLNEVPMNGGEDWYHDFELAEQDKQVTFGAPVPSERGSVFIDQPQGEISAWSFQIAGWVAAPNAPPPITLDANGCALTPVVFERPDVTAALAAQGYQGYSSGFAVNVNILDIFRPANAAAPCQSIRITLRSDGEQVVREVAVTESLWRGLSEQFAIRQQTRAWCLDRLRCPVCRNAGERLLIRRDALVCSSCRTEIPQPQNAIDMLPPALRNLANLTPATAVSSNPYEELARNLIEQTTAAGGWVLDCGAGSRPARIPHVVNVEIEDYFSTDVLAVGENLPFQDGVFDAAVSLAVLEHVRDPFACARELVRVVKPGGEIVCSVPFLQPVHGFPDHYYNMTRSGLTNLFGEGAEVVDCFTPPNGHPIFAVHWILREYLQGLPPLQRKRFGAMTIAEAATRDPASTLADGIATELGEAAKSVIACLNTVRVRRRVDTPVSVARAGLEAPATAG